jgi:acyl dehydratase
MAVAAAYDCVAGKDRKTIDSGGYLASTTLPFGKRRWLRPGPWSSSGSRGVTMQIYFEDVSVGQERIKLAKGPIQRNQHVMYASASGDFNPLHTDDDFAKAVGMKDGVIAHEMLIMGFVGQAITAWVPQKTLRKFGVRFSGMIKLGSTITFTGKAIDKWAAGNIISCEVTAQDETGNVTLTGLFEAALPSRV